MAWILDVRAGIAISSSLSHLSSSFRLSPCYYPDRSFVLFSGSLEGLHILFRFFAKRL